MYAWIDGEKWAADGQPALTEEHGFLVRETPTGGRRQLTDTYGRVLSDADAKVVLQALMQSRLPLFDVDDRAEL